MRLHRRLGYLGTFLALGVVSLVLSLRGGPLAESAFALDSDSDGLSDDFESAYGTDPFDDDSDGDGWTDWHEVFVTGTDPNNVDTDGDGQNDNVDANPLDDLTVGGGSADGRTTPSTSYASNLTRPNLNGTSPSDGNGVLVHSGELVHTVEFMRIDSGYGPPIVLTGTYRSGISTDNIFGNNWVFSFGERVVEDGGTGNATYYPGRMTVGGTMVSDFSADCCEDPWMGIVRGGVQAGGLSIPFTKPGGAGSTFTFNGPTDAVYFTMAKGSFIVEDTHGNKRTFDNSGKITSESDRFGNTTTYTYNGSNQLTNITDATGHYVDITYYSTTGRVKDVTDDSGRKVEFIYNYFGQLAKWKTPVSGEYPAGRTYQYLYTNGSSTGTLNDNLIAAIDPKGQTWLKVEYDANDRVTKQYVGNDYLTFSYAGSVTTVYDREGNQREWTTSSGLPTQLREYSNRDVRAGDPSYWDTTFGHYTSGLLKKIVYPEGNRIDFTYDSKGNVTEVRRRITDTDTNAGTDLVESNEYDATYNLRTSHTDANGNETTFTLDTNDKVVETITYPTVTYLDPDQTVEETFTWTGTGLLDSVTDGEGKVTDYQYVGGGTVKKGYLWKVVFDSGGLGLALTTEYGYTNWGTVTSVKNPRAYTTTYTVNNYDWRTAVTTTSPQGYEVKYTFDANGNVTKKEVENVDKTNTRDTGNPWFDTTWTYDILNNRTAMTEEIDSSTTRTTSYSYTKNERVEIVTNPEGNKVKFEYDERDLRFKRIRGYTSGDASTEQWDYDGNRNAVTYKNGRGKSWTFAYDDYDRRIKATNPLGHYAEMVYDDNGNLTELKQYEEAGLTDVLMAHTKFTYDEMDRRYMTERGLEGSPSWTWYAMTHVFDKRSLVVEMEDACANSTFFTYDGARRRTRTEDALGNQVDFTYDANGNVTKVEETEVTGHSSAKVFVTDFQYDELDRRKQRDVVDQTNGSNKHTTTWKYDSLHVLVEQVDPESNTITWTHDGLGRVLTRSKDLGSSQYIVTTWGFDDNSRLVSHKDDGNNETTWDYNDRDLVDTETYADTGTKTYSYDLADNVVEWVDPNGTEVDLTYDDNNRNTARTITRGTGVGGTTSESYSFDALDRLLEAQDNDVTVQFTWDTLGRKLTETSGPNPISTYGKTTSYDYDPCGQVIGIDYPDGSFSVTRTIDELHRTTLIEDGSGNDIVAATYFGAGGRLKQLAFENLTTADHDYDGFRWLSDLDHKTSTPTTFAGYDMAYDKVGNMVYEEWSHDSGKGNNYSYDKAYRLRTALLGTDDPSNEHANPNSEAYVQKREYNLSDDSDRSSVVTTPYLQPPVSVSYTSNAVHEYTVVGGVSRTYDDNGNLTDDGTNTYEYDYRNQLIEVSDGVGTIAEYQYDALGRRTKKVLPGGAEVRFYHAGVHEIEEFDENGTLLRKYVYRDTIDSIAMMEAPDVADVDDDLNTSELKRFYYHYDGRTNVARLTDPDEAVVESYETDPYGQVSTKDKSGSCVSTTQVGNPFTFQRRRLDDETGLMYFRARHYDPVTGHWLQRDPLGFEPGPNWHEFESCNPVNREDPFGLDDKDDKEAKEDAEQAKKDEAAKKALKEAAKEYGDELRKLRRALFWCCFGKKGSGSQAIVDRVKEICDELMYIQDCLKKIEDKEVEREKRQKERDKKKKK